MIRIENEHDHSAVKEVIREAFLTAEHSDQTEHELVERLRRSQEFVPELSLVYVADDKIVGHIMFTKIKVGEQEALGMAPLSVLPAYQNQGIGSMLMKAGIESARELGYKGIVLLGHPDYYPRFGFVKASMFNIACPFPVPDESYMALELTTGSLADINGMVEYSKAFME